MVGPGNLDDPGVIQVAWTVENLGACRQLQVGEDLDQVPRRELGRSACTGCVLCESNLFIRHRCCSFLDERGSHHMRMASSQAPEAISAIRAAINSTSSSEMVLTSIMTESA